MNDPTARARLERLMNDLQLMQHWRLIDTRALAAEIAAALTEKNDANRDLG